MTSKNDTEQAMKDFQERIEDTMTTMRAIKGDNLANFTHALFACAHFMRMLSMFVKHVEHGGIGNVVGMQASSSISAMTQLVVDAMKISDADLKEAQHTSDILLGYLEIAKQESENGH